MSQGAYIQYPAIWQGIPLEIRFAPMWSPFSHDGHKLVHLEVRSTSEAEEGGVQTRPRVSGSQQRPTVKTKGVSIALLGNADAARNGVQTRHPSSV